MTVSELWPMFFAWAGVSATTLISIALTPQWLTGKDEPTYHEIEEINP